MYSAIYSDGQTDKHRRLRACSQRLLRQNQHLHNQLSSLLSKAVCGPCNTFAAVVSRIYHEQHFNVAYIMLIIAKTTGVQTVAMNGNSNTRVI